MPAKRRFGEYPIEQINKKVRKTASNRPSQVADLQIRLRRARYLERQRQSWPRTICGETPFRLLPHEFAVALPTDRDVHGPVIDIMAENTMARLTDLLAELFKCKTCLRNKRCTRMNFPCGHIANCAECVPFMKVCAICDESIETTLPIPRFLEPQSLGFGFYARHILSSKINLANWH